MRQLIWLAAGFAAGCGLCSYMLPVQWILPIAAVAIITAIAATVAAGEKLLLRRIAVAAMGCAVSLCWFWAFHRMYLLPAAELDAEEIQTSFIASGFGYDGTYGTVFDASMELQGKTYQTRMHLTEEIGVSPGDTVSGTFRFRYTGPGDMEEGFYHSGKGLFLLCYQKGEVQIASAQQIPARYYPVVWAERIKGILREMFPEDAFALAQALLLGETSSLDYETDTHLKLSGIRHVVAVSGLHVSILFTLISMVTLRRRLLTAILGFPVLLVFSAMAGFTPSVTRACIMSALMLAAQLLEKEYDGPTALAFSAVVMLAVNPLVITSVSFQLSVASAGGIFLFQPGIYVWLQRQFSDHKAWYARWLSGSVSVTLSAMTLTVPLSAWHFGTVSLIGVVTNLLSLWVISFIFYGIMAVAGVYLVWGSSAVWLAKLVLIPLRYVLWISRSMGRLPMAAVYTKSPYITAWLVFCYLLLLIFLLSKNRKPAVLSCCAALGLCAALLASWAEPMLDNCRITVLDVGQGQSILLQSQGRTYLVDCGGDSDSKTADIVAETLMSQGIRQLDGLILTHFDRDHAGGAGKLLTRIPADLVLVPAVSGAETFAADEKTVYLDRDMTISFGTTEITVFGPVFGGNSNENSLCVLFDSESCDILITGDRSDFGERMLLRKTQLPDVDVLVAGHHGAGDSTSVELLSACSPETVMISVGDNSYGHPSPQLLERLAQFGCRVYRTDQNGTITYRR